jgi:hypothetical protein
MKTVELVYSVSSLSFELQELIGSAARTDVFREL